MKKFQVLLVFALLMGNLGPVQAGRVEQKPVAAVGSQVTPTAIPNAESGVAPIVGVPSGATPSSSGQPKVVPNIPQGWHLYIDPEFQWSIQYPDEWSVKVVFENPSSRAEQVIRQRVALYGPNRATIWIDISENLSGRSAMSWLQTYKQPLLSSKPAETVILNGVLDGQPAVIAIDSKDHTATAQVAWVAVRGQIASEITYLVLDGSAARDTFNSIVESFSWSVLDPKWSLQQPVTHGPRLDESLLPSRPAAESCCGISSPGNVCVCCTNSDGAEVGNCVWWACHTRPDVPCAGNAETWATCAERAGKRVDTTPEAGALAVWTSANHIAYVEGVNADSSSISISEMDCWATQACGTEDYNGVSYRWTDASGPKYIHGDSPTCPSSNDDGVILYYDANYGCAGRGENSGYVIHNGTGFQDVSGSFNDVASSIHVQSGWSVKLYEHIGSGGQVCLNDDDNFSDDQFSNGVNLNDNVSSFEVFDSPNCGNRPPNPPSGGYVVDNGKGLAPTLCWQNKGDPDNDKVQFKVDISISGTSITNSGWRDSVCWRPSQLDGLYGSYQWQVIARDVPYYAKSDWIPFGTFTIKSNQLPTITFSKANSLDVPCNGEIWSNQQNWTFSGTAGDSDGTVTRVVYGCSGDNCNEPNPIPVNGTTTWSYPRNGLQGKNQISFHAYDNDGASNKESDCHQITLTVDLAPPVTTPSLNNEANPIHWPTWFTGSVQVDLRAVDQATLSARSGVREIRHQLDGSGWQIVSGDHTVIPPVNTDGLHSVDYYAVDKVGNQEIPRTITFTIDQTPPSPITGVKEMHGVISGTWQKNVNTPTFTWDPSSDATSGLWGYQLYFGTSPTGTGSMAFLASDHPQWTPQADGVHTGIYYLRGRACDNARNCTLWATLFDFRYDGTPPENPSGITHTAGITNSVWQRTTNLPNFTWPVPHDEGSGIQGYSLYWGLDPAGTSAVTLTANSFQSTVPLCGAAETCTGYLRLRSIDLVDNIAEEWTTGFVLRYDNTPPTVTLALNGGVTQTTQTLLTLNIAAGDGDGSGVYAMRLSGDGQAWTPWEVYATERPWIIPGISRQDWPVYIQVQDAVGLESAVVSRTIYLDVNPRQPRSANFRLFDQALSAGAESFTSTSYTSRGTIGQVMDSAKITSTTYSLWGGYQAGSQARPIVDPGHDDFTFINGIFASGTGATAMTSSLYLMQSTLGELGLPNNTTTITSTSFQHQPGFLAAALPHGTPTPTPTPGPTPTPELLPACEFPRISINSATMFTWAPSVTLSICAPRAAQMIISNDGGFGGAVWEPYAESKAWTLTSSGQYVLPRFVYIAFKDAAGRIYSTYFDDVILDPMPPAGTISTSDIPLPIEQMRIQRLNGVTLAQPVTLLSDEEPGGVNLYVNAQDDNSGLADMQFSDTADFGSATWEAYSALKPWTPTQGDGLKQVYVRFRDSAGNVSTVVSTTFVLDSLAPEGQIILSPSVVGPNAITVTLRLNAADNLSGVTDMRISVNPSFTNTAWQAYTPAQVWPVYLTGQSQETLYAQYRDLAGNVSPVYSTTYVVDSTPPEIYVEVAPGSTLTRTVTIQAYDELADVATLRLSNDPLMIEGVVTLPYTPIVTWVFDNRGVVWVQVEDSLGNRSEAVAIPAIDILPVLHGRVTLEKRGLIGDPRWITPLYRVNSSGVVTGWVRLYQPGTSNLAGVYSTTTDATGQFTVTLDSVPSGVYDAQVKGANTLSNKRLNVSLPVAGEFEFGTLLVGDNNGDDRVNGGDVSYMIPSFTKCAADAAFRPYADTNNSGCVNGADVSALIPNFTKAGPIIVTGTSASLAGMATAPVAAASDAVRLSLSPLSPAAQVGEVVTLDVVAETGVNRVDTVDAYLDFDPAQLEVVTASGAATDQIDLNPTLAYEITVNTVDNAAGQIDLSASTLTSPPLSGTFTAATIRVRVKSAITAGAVRLVQAQGRHTDLYAAGESLQPALEAGGAYHLHLAAILRQ